MIRNLGDCVEFINGDRGANYPKQVDFVNGDIPFISASDLSNGKLDSGSEFSKKITLNSYDRLRSGKVKKGDILLCLRGSLGKLGVVNDDLIAAIASSLVIMRPREAISHEFLFQWMKSADFQSTLSSLDNGSVQGNLSVKSISGVCLPDFSEKQQHAIAHILGTLDDKIELNQKMNQTLEDIAKAIFKSWFVDFDPVRAKAEGRHTCLPAEISDLFPDAFEDSEIGEIPRGWALGTLSDVADVTMGQSPPGDTYNDDGVGLPFYQGSTDFGFRFPSLRKYCSEPKRLANADDVLMSVRAPVGDINRAKDNCCIGRGLASIKAKNDLRSWVFYRCKYLTQQLETFNSEGTVFGSINGKDLKGLTIVLAPKVLCNSFNDLASPIDDAVRLRTEEIQILTELRDTLLPKLISGELRIPDAEKFLEEAGI